MFLMRGFEECDEQDSGVTILDRTLMLHYAFDAVEEPAAGGVGRGGSGRRSQDVEGMVREAG
jgi:hypothetical protein